MRGYEHRVLALSSAARATNDSALPRVPGMELAARNRSGNAISACGPLQHGSSESAILYAASSSPSSSSKSGYCFGALPTTLTTRG
jgi:hypothetical protein